MTDAELWEAIHRHNRCQRIREQKLMDIQKLMPPADKVLPIEEVLPLLKQIRQILETRM